MRKSRTKRTPRLRKIILPLTAIVKVEMKANQIKFQIGLLRKILVRIETANKANLSIPPQSAVTLPLLRRAKSKVTET